MIKYLIFSALINMDTVPKTDLQRLDSILIIREQESMLKINKYKKYIDSLLVTRDSLLKELKGLQKNTEIKELK